MNIANKLFIFKYVFVIDVNIDKDVDKKSTFLRNYDTNLDKRESFDKIIDFNVICKNFSLSSSLLINIIDSTITYINY